MVRTRCYRAGELHREGFPIDDVSEYLKDEANTVWFDLCKPDEADLERVREELDLHDLAVEDVLSPGQRPKVDRYPEHLLVIAYALGIDERSGALRTHEVGIFVTQRAVVTVRADEGFDIDAVVRRWNDTVGLAGNGVSFLLHGILDYIVDSHFETAGKLDAEVDRLEDRLFDEATSDTTMQRRTFQVRKNLVTIRRLVVPMRDVVNTLTRRDVGIVDGDMIPYFQDVYDQVLRVGEWTDSLRDLLANMLETRLAVRANRTNVVMKKVTSWAAIIAVPTAVTGFYGMNLPYPGSEQQWGVWVSIGLIVVVSVSLYAIFKRRNWL
jgi:magnesium transporter